jgi:hypothetical protein
MHTKEIDIREDSHANFQLENNNEGEPSSHVRWHLSKICQSNLDAEKKIGIQIQF